MSNKLFAWCKASSCHHGAYEKMERAASLSNIYGHVLSSSCVSNFLSTFCSGANPPNQCHWKTSRWKMEASRRQPACESEPAGGGTQQATGSRREQEANRRKSTGGRRMPAGDSRQARERTDKLDRCGSQQATASRREKEASRWKPAGGRWKPAGDSHHTRVDMLEVEANRQQPVGGSRKPAGESQQVEDGCQQATASSRERERTS